MRNKCELIVKLVGVDIFDGRLCTAVGKLTT